MAEDLINAIRQSDCVTVAHLLNGGVLGTDAPPRRVYLALLNAVKYGNHEVLEMLIGANVPLRHAETQESSFLHWAIKRERPDRAILQTLLNTYPEDINRYDAAGYTPLHCAAMRGDILATALLLKHGAYVDAAGPWNASALSLAVDFEHVAVVELLLKAGAKYQLPGDTYSVLHEAATAKDYAVLKVLITHAQSIDLRDTDGDTPLHWAALFGVHTNGIECLLASCADPTICNYEGDQPVDLTDDFAKKELLTLASKQV